MEIMNIKELSEYLKISISTVRRLIQKGEIPFFKISSQYFFSKTAINDWINSQVKVNFKEK